MLNWLAPKCQLEVLAADCQPGIGLRTRSSCIVHERAHTAQAMVWLQCNALPCSIAPGMFIKALMP